jgi:hypothetical protein
MGTSSVLRLRMPVLILGLAAAGAALTARAPAASAAAETTQFDGNYKGFAVLTTGSGYQGCDTSLPGVEQTMTVSGDRVYLERKSSYNNPSPIYAGTVSADGSVSASGLIRRTDRPEISVVSTLTGKIENNEFTGILGGRNCSFSIKMKR